MQILGPVLALLAFRGGLFIPLDQLGEAFRTIATFTPMYGLNQLVHAPLVHVPVGSWHWLGGELQATVVPAPQVPAPSQISPVVQLLPSLQEEPNALNA